MAISTVSSPKKISTVISTPSKSTSCRRPFAPRMIACAMDFPPFVIHSRLPRRCANEDGPDGKRIESCTIAVTQANDSLRPIHDRMPAILDGDHFDSWLDTKAPVAEAKALLRPYTGAMTLFPVSSRVNAVRNDDPD